MGQSAVAKLGRCSLCNQGLTKRDIRPLVEEIQGATNGSLSSDKGTPVSTAAATSSSSSTAAAPAPAPADNFDKYGTKLAAVVRKLQDLRREDPTAKVILFVQFDELK